MVTFGTSIWIFCGIILSNVSLIFNELSGKVMPNTKDIEVTAFWDDEANFWVQKARTCRVL